MRKISNERMQELLKGLQIYIDEHFIPLQTEKEASPLPSGSKPQAFLGNNSFAAFGDAVSQEPGFFGAASAKAGLFETKAKADRRKAKRSLEDLMSNVAQTWQESLFRLIDEKGYTDSEVYKRANVDRKLFSKIRSNPDYKPKKNTAVAFALALKLNLDEVKDFLGRAGYALSPSSRFDLIIEYFVEEEVYDIYTINLALFEHDQPLLE